MAPLRIDAAFGIAQTTLKKMKNPRGVLTLPKEGQQYTPALSQRFGFALCTIALHPGLIIDAIDGGNDPRQLAEYLDGRIASDRVQYSSSRMADTRKMASYQKLLTALKQSPMIDLQRYRPPLILRMPCA